MIRFKTPDLEIEFNDSKLSGRVRVMLLALDGFMWWKFNRGIMITSLFRSGDTGVHGRWRGADIRTKDWSALEAKTAEAWINKYFKYDPERPGLPSALYHNVGKGEHLHLQSMPGDSW